MFDTFLNTIFLKIWSGDKKVGPHKKVLMSRSCEIYQDTVYDLKWTLKYVHRNGKASHSVTISERASKWNLRRTIRKVEKHELPKKIDELIREHSHTDQKE